MESEEGNKRGDIRMTQVLGREPIISFSKDKDTPAQFIQALKQQERRQDWPMLCSLTIQMEHCDYCLRDDCSLINHKRHIELHKRNSDEESAKNRKFLAQFWDKISSEEAKEVVSLKNLVLKEVSGSSIIKELTNIVRKEGFSYLPEPYGKDIIKGGRFPISLEQLFTVLDCTSEETFLCGPTSCLQKHIMDVNKTEIESMNVIAYTGIIKLEQKLIGAWLADREAESERLRKILEEEEEVTQKRRGEDLEKNKQKKPRKREQREDEQGIELKEDLEVVSEEPFSAVEHTDADVVVSDEQTAYGRREIDSGYRSNLDENPFFSVVGCKWRHRLLRSSEAVEPSSSHEDQSSLASALASDSQSPKLTMSPIKSHQEAQHSRASNLDLTPMPPRLATYPSNSRPAQDSQAPKFAGFLTYSDALQGHHDVQGPLAPSSANGCRASNARSHVPQFCSTAAHRSRLPRHRGAHRSASLTSQNVLTFNGEPESGGDFSEAKLQYTEETDPPNLPTTEKEADEKARNKVTLSSTSESVNWAKMVEEEAWQEPEAPAKQQQTTDEQGLKIKRYEDSSSHEEPKEPYHVQSGPTAVLLTETLVPNGSRDLDAGFVNMKGKVFENLSWEAGILRKLSFKSAGRRQLKVNMSL